MRWWLRQCDDKLVSSQAIWKKQWWWGWEMTGKVPSKIYGAKLSDCRERPGRLKQQEGEIQCYNTTYQKSSPVSSKQSSDAFLLISTRHTCSTENASFVLQKYWWKETTDGRMIWVREANVAVSSSVFPGVFMAAAWMFCYLTWINGPTATPYTAT